MPSSTNHHGAMQGCKDLRKGRLGTCANVGESVDHKMRKAAAVFNLFKGNSMGTSWRQEQYIYIYYNIPPLWRPRT